MAERTLGPCENCGAINWRGTTQGEVRHVLTVIDQTADKAQFQSSTGIPVDLYFCTACGNVRLFTAVIPR